MKYNEFTLIQERIKELDLFEISEEIQDIFFEWSDKYDLQLLIFLGYVNEQDWIIPLWNILENCEFSRGISEIYLDNTSILNCHLTIQFGLERRDIENRESQKSFEEKIYQLQEIRENFISRLNNALEFEVVSDLYEYVTWANETTWARKLQSRVPVSFRITIKDPKYR